MLPLCPGTMPGNGKGRVPVGSVNATNLEAWIVACGAGPQPRAVALFAGNNAISVELENGSGWTKSAIDSGGEVAENRGNLPFNRAPETRDGQLFPAAV